MLRTLQALRCFIHLGCMVNPNQVFCTSDGVVVFPQYKEIGKRSRNVVAVGKIRVSEAGPTSGPEADFPMESLPKILELRFFKIKDARQRKQLCPEPRFVAAKNAVV